VSVYATGLHAAESTLKDLVAHFEKSGMPLDEVRYVKKLTKQQQKQGIPQDLHRCIMRL
jgi:hypothetical protein